MSALSDDPISLKDFRASKAKGARARKPLYFARDELGSLMQVYSSQVAAGRWRDYAIDFAPGLAVFAVYKAAHEAPLYTVAKRLGPNGKGREFVLHEGKKPLKRSAELQDVLRHLELRACN